MVFAAMANSLVAHDSAATTDLLTQAIQLEDLRADGSPPLNYLAELEVTLTKDRTAKGDYSLQWVSSSQSREEIRFANFQRVRVQTATGYWQKRNLEYQPQVIFHLETLLDLNSLLKLGTNESLGKARETKQGGARLSCLEVKRAGVRQRELCFDQSSGVLVSVDFPTGSNQHPPEITRIEYSDFAPWEGKVLPHKIRASSAGKDVAAVRVLQLATLTNFDSTLFDLPQNAEFWTSCKNDVIPAKLENRVQPQYPSGARANRVQGRVTFYGVVEADGTLSHLTIIHPADRDLEAVAAQAIRQWRYKPPTCNGTPIRTETSISVDFWLEQ
jgi:TonB family protein